MHLIEKTIEVDAGHRVPHHNSQCKNLHGHRYKIIARLSGELETVGSSHGMVLDFGNLKQSMIRCIHSRFDHRMILWERDPLVALEFARGLGVVTVPCIPTAEGLAEYWFGLLKVDLETTRQLKLEALRVYETPNSVGEYRP